MAKRTDFAPMLAERKSAHTYTDKLVFPLYVGPKLDGIRCLILNNQAVSRKLLPVENNFMREVLSRPEFNGLDGELIVGPPNAEDVCNRTGSVVNGNKHTIESFSYYVFDDFGDPTLPFVERRDRFMDRVHRLQSFIREQKLPLDLRPVHSDYCTTWDQVVSKEEQYLQYGFEGAILRSEYGAYKYGRSTAREQGMLKLKRLIDGEAEITEIVELQRNNNEAQTDELGHTKRSSAQANLVPGDTLGAFIAVDLTTNVEFRIGMFKGLSDADKKAIWDQRHDYIGSIVKYSSFPIGVKEKPRHAKFIAFRARSDF